jgi:hypothetical protein
VGRGRHIGSGAGDGRVASRFSRRSQGAEGARRRRPGAGADPASRRGRKRTIDQDPTLVPDLEKLIEPTTREDPESPLPWTCKSVRRLATELTDKGHRTSHRMVAALLPQLGRSSPTPGQAGPGKSRTVSVRESEKSSR